MTYPPFVSQMYLDDCIAMAIQAGKIAQDIYQSGDHGVRIKGDKSPVTKADQAVESYLETCLSQMTPHIPIIGEEAMSSLSDTQGETHHHYEQFWLLDPIDGTRDFIERTGAYAINIALIEQGVPVFGMIYAPSYHNQLFVGGVGIGAFRYDCHTHTRHDVLACDVCPITYDDTGKTVVNDNNCDDLNGINRDKDQDEILNPLVVITSGRNKDRYAIKDKIMPWVPHVYMDIGSAIKFTLLASNQAHVYPRFAPSMEWDTASGDAILRQLGGGVMTLDGHHMVYGKPQYRNPHFMAYAPLMSPDMLKL